jgi:hypothetical protein
MYGDFPEDLREGLVTAIAQGWKAAGGSWRANNEAIQDQIVRQLGALSWVGTRAIFPNVPLSDLGVAGSQAEMDVVIHADPGDPALGGFLLHISGHQMPRHEKELLEFMAESLADPRFSYAVFVASSGNRLRLEGNRSSCEYLCGALARLAAPLLGRSNLKGVLVVCVP